MTLTPYGDAARQSIEMAQVLFERRKGRSALQDASDRMTLDTNAACLKGAAEMLDLDGTTGQLGIAVTDAIGTALASVTLTLAGGDEAVALKLVEHCLKRVREVADASVRAAPVRGVVGVSVKHPMAGRA